MTDIDFENLSDEEMDAHYREKLSAAEYADYKTLIKKDFFELSREESTRVLDYGNKVFFGGFIHKDEVKKDGFMDEKISEVIDSSKTIDDIVDDMMGDRPSIESYKERIQEDLKSQENESIPSESGTLSAGLKAALLFIALIALTFGEGVGIAGLFISLLLVAVFIWSMFDQS